MKPKKIIIKLITSMEAWIEIYKKEDKKLHTEKNNKLYEQYDFYVNRINELLEAKDIRLMSESVDKEDLAVRLERKAKTAEDLLSEVEVIKSAYDREKKDKLLRKTTKWLENFAKISDDTKTEAIKSHFPKIQEAHNTVKAILDTDDKITKGLDQVFGALEKFMQAPDHKAPDAQKLAQKIKAALGQVIPLIKKVKDTDLLNECIEIEKMLAQ